MGNATTVDAASVRCDRALEIALRLLQFGDVLRGEIAPPIEIVDQPVARVHRRVDRGLARAPRPSAAPPARCVAC